MRTRLLALVATFAVGCSSSRPTSAPPSPSPHDLALEKTLGEIVARHDGTVGVTVKHLGTGAFASVNGSARLPMMSVFKLPLAVMALKMVEEGALKLDQSIAIEERELRPGVSPIAEDWNKGEHSFTLETILRRTIQQSDNTGGDKLVALTRPRTSGFVGVDVVEQEIEIFARIECPGVAKPADGWTFPKISACPKPQPAIKLAAAQKEIDASPNAASSDALVDMLASIDRGTALNASNTAWLRDVLAGTTTGLKRLKAKLPAGTRVEHKTGTGDTVEGVTIATNDVGVITLPDGSRFAIAVLGAGSHKDLAAREGVIAELARAAWDRFSSSGK